jgi:cyd operon protein YbgT
MIDYKEGNMWYFTWFIGVTMAVLLSVMHALWFEVQADETILRKQNEGG